MTVCVANDCLDTRQVHVWCVSLAGGEPTGRDWMGLLCAAEVARAERIRIGTVQQQFIRSHGVLRLLLAAYLDTTPSALRFVSGRLGKPRICSPACDLDFNMSHAGELAVYGIVRNCNIGIDVEQVAPLAEMEAIARHHFSIEEVDSLAAVAESERFSAFYRCWTRKEAYVKARGLGLSARLADFSVTFREHERPAICVHGAGVGANWSVRHLAPGPGYIGAIVYEGSERHVKVECTTADRLLHVLSRANTPA